VTSGIRELPPNYRWNFALLFTGSVSFGAMTAFVSIDSVIPSLVSHLTDSAFLIGMIGTVFNISALLPQLVIAGVVQRSRRLKPILLTGGFMRLGAQLLVPISFWLGVTRSPGAGLAVVFAYLAFFSLGDSILALPWLDILARAIPVYRRGRLLGWSQALGRMTGIGAGFIVGRVLGNPALPFPSNYALLFVFAIIALLPTVICLALLREPPRQMTEGERIGLLSGGGLKLVGGDPNFRRLVICRMLVAMSGLASIFYVVHAVDVGGLPMQAIGQFVVAQTIGALLGSLGFGWLSERRGPVWVIRAGSLIVALAPIAAFGVNAWPGVWSTWAYRTVFFALGILETVWFQGFSNYLLEAAPDGMRPLYVGASSTIASLATFAPILGGWLLGRTSYGLLFGLTAVLLCCGFAASFTLRSTYEDAELDKLTTEAQACRKRQGH